MRNKYSRRGEKLIPGTVGTPRVGDFSLSHRYLFQAYRPLIVGLDAYVPFAPKILMGLKSQRYKGMREALKGFEGIPFVDLGAGKEPFGYAIACELKASCYIGLECHFPEELDESMPCASKLQERAGKAIPYAIVPEPILVFLNRLPNECVNTFASGIDENIMSNKDARTDEISDEIKRVLVKGGLHLSYHSIFRPDGLACEKLRNPSLRKLKTLLFKKQ
ncbi:MAG: hypothetical protein UR15_C0040G0003 [Parcubacteria group bacterium GW2011_GWA2_31_28]|nr:MAG: hypothetical protein UR15_C0040G0003 [Parcubacteria group bacterium GW2011_GWA2_31_28]